MKTIEEKIAVMQAFADGKKIELIRYSLTNTNDWIEDPNPCWDWFNFDYRIKPEPKYRPYANAKECIADVKKHGGWIKELKRELYLVLECVGESGCCFEGKFTAYRCLVRDYVWADDGSPCGILEED